IQSTVPLQALTLLNNAFLLEQADFFAERVTQSGGSGPDTEQRQIETAFLLAFGRPPGAQEVAASRLLLSRQRQRYLDARVPGEEAERKALAHLCHDLFCASEFLFVE